MISVIGKSGKTSWIERVGNVVKTTVNEGHCCGLQGFNPMLGDTCLACELDEALRQYERRTKKEVS